MTPLWSNLINLVSALSEFKNSLRPPPGLPGQHYIQDKVKRGKKKKRNQTIGQRGRDSHPLSHANKTSEKKEEGRRKKEEEKNCHICPCFVQTLNNQSERICNAACRRAPGFISLNIATVDVRRRGRICTDNVECRSTISRTSQFPGSEALKEINVAKANVTG
jgi:hypothetical protein